MGNGKPIILIVHGAWHRPIHYIALADSLRAEGFTVVSPENVTAGPKESAAGKTHLDDVEIIHKALSPYLEAGEEILVVCHSYGGIPGTASIEGHTVAERASKGLKGGIKSLVYITSFAIPVKGLSLENVVGGQWPDWFDIHDGVISPKDGCKTSFYHDISQSEIENAMPKLVNQSLISFETPTQYVAADIAIPKTYIVCELDKAIPVEGQRAMAGAASAKVVELQSGHSPFLKEEERAVIVKVICEAASAE